jgi:beta-galactosidase
MWKDFAKNLQQIELSWSPDSLTFYIRSDYMSPDKLSGLNITYIFNGKGELGIVQDLLIHPANAGYPEIPAVGMKLVLSGEFSELEYFGRGPHENYIDRNTSALVGLYNSSVEEQYVPYPAPQENGNKTEVRWLSLKNKDGLGLLFQALPAFEFSALHFSPDQLSRATPGIRHMSDPLKQEEVFLTLNHKQMGVGGDDSWGAKTHAKYSIPAVSMQFAYFIKPLEPKDDSWDKLK